MNPNNQTTIEPLHKVTLTLAPEPSAVDNAATVTLIVGLGVEGLTSIEQQLIGRSVGDTFSVDLTSGCWESAMAPIPSLPKIACDHEVLQQVTITIKATQPATPREVVKEMAFMIERNGCGCGGGCDCGCG